MKDGARKPLSERDDKVATYITVAVIAVCSLPVVAVVAGLSWRLCKVLAQ